MTPAPSFVDGLTVEGVPSLDGCGYLLSVVGWVMSGDDGQWHRVESGLVEEPDEGVSWEWAIEHLARTAAWPDENDIGLALMDQVAEWHRGVAARARAERQTKRLPDAARLEVERATRPDPTAILDE